MTTPIQLTQYQLPCEVSHCSRSREWFTGEIDPDGCAHERHEAITYLEQHGLIVAVQNYADRTAPHPFELTVAGRSLLATLENIRNQKFVDWQQFRATFPD